MDSNATPSPADACRDRCQRLHPHCQLRLTRDVAPDSGWHWSVTMPDGHVYDSRGAMTFEAALADMQARGVAALDAADMASRNSHSEATTPGSVANDLLMYGTAFSQGGRRIDPRDMVVHLPAKTPPVETVRAWPKFVQDECLEVLRNMDTELGATGRKSARIERLINAIAGMPSAEPVAHGEVPLPFSPYLVSEWKSLTERHTWTAYTEQQMRDFAAACLTAQPRAVPAECVVDNPLTGKYAEVLAPFLTMMDHELHANSGKGDRPGWLSMDRKTALLEIYYHLAKLQKAAKNDDLAGVREFSADVANMSMMLADICGVLATTPSPGESAWNRDDEDTLICLQLVSQAQHVTAEQIATWTDEQCKQAEWWALAIHFRASDNDDVRIPPKPDCIGEPPATPETGNPVSSQGVDVSTNGGW